MCFFSESFRGSAPDSCLFLPETSFVFPDRRMLPIDRYPHGKKFGAAATFV